MEYLNKAKERITEFTTTTIKRHGYVKPALVVLGGTILLCKLLKRFGFFAKKDVKGEVVFLTGGGMGIGKQMALALGLAGAKVAIADIRLDFAEAVAASINASGGTALAVRCDVGDPSSIAEAAQQVQDRLGAVTILINNAGIVSGQKILDNTLEAMERTIRINLTAHLYTIKQFLPDMVKKNHGHIVSIASLAGYIGISGMVDYSASKFGAVGLMESLRNELKLMGSGVKTTCVNPYYINTGMFEGVSLYNRWLFPMLDEKYVARRVLQAIRQETEVLVLPASGLLGIALKGIVSSGASDAILSILGLSKSMETFKGRTQR